MNKQSKKESKAKRVTEFLNDSGGNFTENSPRPPVPGEETERQSNGGNSSRSTGSNKSHISNTSGRSGNEKSPSITPRKSNLDKPGTFREKGEPPLGFEPEGSAANSPPFTENGTPPYDGTPPYCKWAENLNYLLEDSDGVKLYQQFLVQMECSNILDFWFACRGLKLLEAVDVKRIAELSKVIYKRFIRGDKLNLGSGLTKPISECLKSGKVDQNIFDHAQAKVEVNMRENTYRLFLESDLFLQYIRTGGESPKSGQQSNSNVSSGSSSVRPLSRPLPTVQEGQELRHEDLNDSIKEMPPPALPPPPRTRKTHHHKMECAPSSSFHSESPVVPGGYYPNDGVMVPKKAPYMYHNSFAPVSANDSEGQSLSSDAHTDTDTLSMTDNSSVDGRDHQPHLRHHRPSSRYRSYRIQKNMKQNRHTELHHNHIPRTEHAPKDRNIAEVDPARFAQMVTERLEALQAEQLTHKKLQQTLQQNIDLSESLEHDKSLLQHQMPHNFSSLSTSMTSSQHNPVLIPSFNPSANQSMNQSVGPILNATAHSFCEPPMNVSQHVGYKSSDQADSTVASLDADDSAQSILDNHVSHVWDSSSGQTPARSPGQHSPDRIAAPAHVDKSRSFLANPSQLYGPKHTKRGRDPSYVDPQVQPFGPYAAGKHASVSASHHFYHSSDSAPAEGTHASSRRHHMQHPMLYRDEYDTSGYREQHSFPSSRGRNKRSSAKKTVDTSVLLDNNNSLPLEQTGDVPGLSFNRVMDWMRDSEKWDIGGGKGGSTDNSERSSSHKRSSHRSSSGQQQQQAQQHRQSKKHHVLGGSRSGSLDRSLLNSSAPLMTYGVTQGGNNASAPGGPDCNYSVMPSHYIAQDPQMPLMAQPNIAAQLEEAKRRLEEEAKMMPTKMKQSRSFTAQPVKDRKNMAPPLYNRIGSTAKGAMPPGAPMSGHNLTLEEKDSFKKAASVPNTPVAPPVGGSLAMPAGTASASGHGSHPPSGAEVEVITVVYYMGDEKIPYRTTITGKQVSLAQFKNTLGKRGNYRYYFKKHTSEFEAGAVMEEVFTDDSILPLWEGRVHGKVQKIEPVQKQHQDQAPTTTTTVHHESKVTY